MYKRQEYPLGTDNLGRCILSRMIYGIRPTLGLAVLTMLGTIGLGALMGLLAGYFRGITAVSYTHLDVYKRQACSCSMVIGRASFLVDVPNTAPLPK